MPRNNCKDCGSVVTSMTAERSPTHSPGLADDLIEVLSRHCTEPEAGAVAVLDLLASPEGAAATLAHLRSIGRTGVAYTNPQGGPATTLVTEKEH